MGDGAARLGRRGVLAVVLAVLASALLPSGASAGLLDGLLGGQPPPPPPPPGPETSPPPASCPKTAHQIPLGAAVWSKHFGDPKYKATAAHCFDSVTTENDMKMWNVEPSPGKYDFTKLDEVVNFATANGKRIRGHTLVYEQNPGWVNILAINRSLGLSIMNDYIRKVMTRYRGRIAQYDVVNEAFYGAELKQTVWARSIGPDYIEQAFRTARATDPGAKLFYNDTGGEEPGPKAAAILAMVKDFKARGVPIDGVGLEFHIESAGYAPNISTVLNEFRALGVAVEITELDVTTSQGDDSADQREDYVRIARACQESPNCTGVTTWGVSDQYSWRGLDKHALLFSANSSNGYTYDAKLAYPAVRSALDMPRAAAP